MPAPCSNRFVIAGLSLSARAVPEPELYESFLTRIVTQVMTSQHYTRQNLNDDLAGEIYGEYLDTLDPSRRFFLKSDVTYREHFVD